MDSIGKGEDERGRAELLPTLRKMAIAARQNSALGCFAC
jgi:hypothetical protein